MEIKDGALEVHVKISPEQVEKIVIASLLSKFKAFERRGELSSAEMYKCVLLDYLTRDELAELLDAAWD